MLTKNRKVLTILLIISLAIHFFSIGANRVENLYSTQFYVVVSEILRVLLGWIPISLGDLFYGIAVAWFIFKLIKWLNWRKPTSGTLAARAISRSVRFLKFSFWIYIVFNLLWGLNYNREGIATQIGLDMQNYTVSELREISCVLVDKINTSQKVIARNNLAYPENKALFRKVDQAFVLLEKKYPFLKYDYPSIKPSMWGWIGNYGGFNGYYNPFTAEAQLNTTIPKFLQPFVACHEVAHQVGYAKEMEANFVGYLAATASTDTLFHYSVYLDLFAYANRAMFQVDSSASKLYFRDLAPAVKSDIAEWRRFNRRHKNPVEPLIRWIYGKYLQGNQQPEGMMSYDRVTSFLIAYYKKFGDI